MSSSTTTMASELCSHEADTLKHRVLQSRCAPGSARKSPTSAGTNLHSAYLSWGREVIDGSAVGRVLDVAMATCAARRSAQSAQSFLASLMLVQKRTRPQAGTRTPTASSAHNVSIRDSWTARARTRASGGERSKHSQTPCKFAQIHGQRSLQCALPQEAKEQ